MVVFGFVVFCFTVILREGEKRQGETKEKNEWEEFDEREEIT
jgi:hypothetical protein